MIRCRTRVNINMIKALAKYHIKHKKNAKRNRLIAISWSVILLLISLINAYGVWIKYYDTEPILIILIKSSIFVILSIFILYMSIDGSININRELKKYFTKTNTNYIDYIIDENSIQLIINGNSSSYHWNQIDNFECDDIYYYFSSNGRHSIIEKEPISLSNRERLEKFFQNNLKQGTHDFEK